MKPGWQRQYVILLAAGMTVSLLSTTHASGADAPGQMVRPPSPPPTVPAPPPNPNPPPAQPAQPAPQPLIAIPQAAGKIDRPRWNQVVSLLVVDGRLTYNSDLTVDQVRWLADNEVEVEGMPGLTSVSIRPRNFKVENVSRVGEDLVTVRVNSSRQGLVVETERESTERTSGVSFSGPSPEPSRYGNVRGNNCSLTAYGRDVPGERTTVEAADFPSLRKEYPHEVNRYLRPLFRKIGSDVLEVSPAAARQVLLNDELALMPPPSTQPATAPSTQQAAETVAAIKPIPATRPSFIRPADEAEVQALLKLANAPRWSEREMAARKLQEMGPRAAAVLSRIDPAQLSAQQRQTVGVVVAAANPLPLEDARRLRDDVHFLVDCLYVNESGIREAALKRLQEVTRSDANKFSRVAAAGLKNDVDVLSASIEALREQLVPVAPR